MKEAQKRNRYFLYKQSSPVHSFILLYILPSIILHPLHPSSKLSSMIRLTCSIIPLKQGIILRIFLLSSVGSNNFQIFFLSIYLSVWKRSIPNYFRAIIFSVLLSFIYLSYFYIFIYLIYLYIYLSIIYLYIYLSIHFLLCHLFNQVCLLSMLWQPRIPSRSANHH